MNKTIRFLGAIAVFCSLALGQATKVGGSGGTKVGGSGATKVSAVVVSGGSVAHDGEANVTGTAAAATTLTITGKTTAGSNRCGVVCVSTNAVDSISGVTWNGVAMTEVDHQTETVGANLFTAMWRIVAPPTGASNIVITFGGATTGKAVASSYSGVNQTTPVANKNKFTTTGAAASPASLTNTTASGEMVVDSVIWTQFDTNAPAVGANQTSLGNQVFGAFYFAMASRQAGVDGGVMSWTYSSTAHWASVTASLQP